MDGYLSIQTELETDNFDAEITYIEQQMQEIQNKLKKADMGFEVGDTSKMEANYQKLNRTLATLKKKQVEAISSGMNWDKVKNSIDSVGGKLTKTIKKMAKWALGIWAVESAYSGIRRIITNIQNSDEQIASNINYMTFTISSALKPVVEWIVNQAFKLLVYLNFILKAWLGIDIFANSVDNYLASTNKNAKELKKSMAGFDNANVLSNASGGNSTPTPKFDIGTPQDVPIPSWLQWITQNGTLVATILGGIAIALVAVKLGVDGITGIGIGLLILGIIGYIEDVKIFLEDPTWENFANYLFDIGLILLGLALIIGGPTGLIVAIIAGIVIVVAAIIKNWDKICEFLGKVGGWIYDNVIQPVVEWFKYMGGQIWKLISEPIENIKRFIGGIVDSVKLVWQGIQKILNGDIKGGLQDIFRGIVNIIITCINFLIDGLNTAIAPIRLLVVAVGKVLGKEWDMDDVKVPKIKYLKHGGIIDVPKIGVPLGGNVRGGEAGPEAVIPLNDETMQRLAKYISRFINIDINLTNKLDSRVLLRILKQIKGENDFARNGD